MNEIYGKLDNKGLHPYFGFIHSDREKHPTFASDMFSLKIISIKTAKHVIWSTGSQLNRTGK
ncbi:MAG: CRISPR-associated endonuclease Cas1 [Clostridiales bacterium]|nr:CRISPR-associated endonuclease Cas1 [Clostridiales bacterium]